MTAIAEPDVGLASASGTITVRPLQPTIGAEVGGVDLGRPLSTAARDEIKAAILQYKVVFFRDQNVDRDQHAAFARRFGPLYVHPSVNKRLPPAARAHPDRRRTPVRGPLIPSSRRRTGLPGITLTGLPGRSTASHGSASGSVA